MKQTYCFFSTFAHRVLTATSARAKLLTLIALCLFSIGNVWGVDVLYHESFANSSPSSTATASASTVTAIQSMFYDKSATVWSHYANCSKISKNSTANQEKHTENYCSDKSQVSILFQATGTAESTILEVTGIDISNATDLKLNFAFKFLGGTNYKAYAKIDDGSYVQIATATSGTTWQYVTNQAIKGTGNQLSLKFTYQPKKSGNQFYLDEVCVTGTKSSLPPTFTIEGADDPEQPGFKYVDFGYVKVGESKTQTITIRTANLTGDVNWQWSASNGLDNGRAYSVTPAKISQSATTTTFTVTFTPTSENMFTGLLYFSGGGITASTDYNVSCGLQFVGNGATESCTTPTFSIDNITISLAQAEGLYDFSSAIHKGGSTGTITYKCTSANSGNIVIEEGNVFASEVGTYNITATMASDGTYCEATTDFTITVAYTINTVANPTNGGTVSLSGNVITATPKSGYRIDATTPYTVTSGTATVAQSGNTFTVTPSSDCTVQINFVPIPSYTVAWMLNGAAYTDGNPTTKVFEGEGITALPTPPADDALGECANKFMGWSTTNLGSEEGKTAPANLFKTVAEAPTITDNTTFYAVFATEETTGGGSTMTWKKITTANELTTEKIYAIITTEEEFYIASDVASSSNPPAQKVTKDGDAIAISDAMKWKVSKDGSGFVFESFSQSGVYLWGSSTNDGIRINTSSGKKNATKVWCPEQDDSYGVVLYNNAEQSNRYLEVYNSTDWRNYTSKTTGKIGVLYVYSSSTPTTYTNYVTACKEEVCNLSEPSNPLSNNITSSGATLTWNAVTGATAYVVTLTTGSVSKEITTTTNSCELTDLQSATDYTWTVKATKGKCESGSCSIQKFTTLVPCTPLAMPTNVKVEWIKEDQYQLSWDKVTNATCYKITGQFSTASIKQNYTIRTLSDLTRGREYSGTIIAMNPGDYRYCDSNPADYSFVYKPYTVTFNAGSGTCPVASSEETTIEELPEAQNNCEGWEFVGWSTIPCSETTTLPALVTAPYTPTSDHTLYAVYAKTEEGGQSNEFNSVDVDYGDLVSGEEYVLTAYNNSVNEYALSCNETDISGNYGTKQISIVTIDEDNDGDGDFYQLTTTDTDIIWSLIGDGINGYYFKHVATGKCLINDAGNLLLSDTGEPIRFLISHPVATSYRVEVQLKDESKYLSGYKKDDKYGILFNIYTRSTLDLYLYKRTSATIYTYSSNPSCTPCNDAEWYFELGSRVQKIPEAANFTNKLISTNTNPVTYKSSNPSVATVNPTTGEVTIVALGETTITAKQSRSGDICPVVADYLLVVQEPQVEVVEVTPNSIILAHDFEGETEVVMQERVTTVEGEVANDIFFSKYFEAASNMKLLALYNGTDHPIDFRKLRIRVAYNDVWPTGTSNGTIVELGKISDLMAKYPSGMLPQLTEIILWSNNYGNTSGAETNNTDLRNCIDLTINKQQYTYADMEAKRIPNWYCIGDPITFAQKDADGHQQMMFGGDDAISLERQKDDGMWTAIDLIGAGTSGAPERTATEEKAGSPLYMDDKGWYNMEVKLSTNRCLLWRKKGVKDGYTAVKKNVTDFVTLGTEWEGRPVSGDDPYCTSGEMFAELAEFDYAHYFTKFVTLPEDRAGITHNPDGTITVKMDDLTDRACDFLNINVLKKGTTDTIAHTYYKVPIIVQGEKLTNDEIFTKEGTACTTCDVVILNNSSLTKAPEGTAGDITAVRDLEVYAGGKLDLPADCSYQVRSLALRSKEDVVSSATLEGDLKILLDNTYHDKRIQASRWYWITLPQDCPVSNVTFRNGEPAEYGVDWLLKTYDGEQRANTQQGGCWKVFGGTTIKAGVGYILAITPKQGHTYRELRFPMSGYGKAAEHSAKDVPVDDYGAGMDITPNHKGWNLVGNPYLSYYRSSSWDGLTVGQLVENDEYEYELAGTIPYVTIPQNAGYSEYTQEAIGEYDLPPFTSYFVQVGGATPHTDPLAVNFAADGRKARSVAERRMPAQTADKAVRVTVALANAAGEQDKTTLVMSNRYTDAYEIGADLLKWRGSQYTRYSKPVLASAGQDGELAFHALADAAAQQGVRLHYFAAQQGEYTFSLVQGYDPLVVKEVILYDTETGTSVNLLQQDYRFRSDRQDNKTRFVLSVRVERTPAVTTGIDRLQTSIYAVGEAGALHLFNLPAGSHVRIYDSLGRLVADDDADALQAVYPVGCAGVYNVSVTVAGENQTLRTIVK